MPYIITNGTEYIMRNRNGKYVTIRSGAMADEYSKQQAEKILNNTLSKKLRSQMYIEKVDDGKEKELKEIPVHSTEVEYQVSEQMQFWIDKLNCLNGLAKEADEREKVLNVCLSTIDKKLSDILHYCEFCTLNAAQGYKVYKKIKEYRQERRKIKNELEIVRFILDKKITDTVSEEAKNLINSINSRSYEPRVLKELFDV